MIKEIVILIQQVGFPIAVSVFLLWRYEKRLEGLANKIGEMSDSLSKIAGYLKGIKDG